MKKNEVKQVVITYLRAAIASTLALYLAGQTDLKTLGYAFLGSVAAPVLKWLDPSAHEFGMKK